MRAARPVARMVPRAGARTAPAACRRGSRRCLGADETTRAARERLLPRPDQASRYPGRLLGGHRRRSAARVLPGGDPGRMPATGPRARPGRRDPAPAADGRHGPGTRLGIAAAIRSQDHAPTRRGRIPVMPVAGQDDAIEAIKQLKARYFRLMDTKQWDAYRQVFTDDMAFYFESEDAPTATSGDDFVAFVRSRLATALSGPHGHM